MSAVETLPINRIESWMKEPFRRVSVSDLDSNYLFLLDEPYISEENVGEHKYLFTLKDGQEKYLDLRGRNYRIVRRGPL